MGLDAEYLLHLRRRFRMDGQESQAQTQAGDLMTDVERDAAHLFGLSQRFRLGYTLDECRRTAQAVRDAR